MSQNNKAEGIMIPAAVIIAEAPSNAEMERNMAQERFDRGRQNAKSAARIARECVVGRSKQPE